jgi:hypothetical protein
MPCLSMICMLSSGCRSDSFLYCPTHYSPPCAVKHSPSHQASGPLPVMARQHSDELGICPQHGQISLPSKGTCEIQLIRLWLLGSNCHSLCSLLPYPPTIPVAPGKWGLHPTLKQTTKYCCCIGHH